MVCAQKKVCDHVLQLRRQVPFLYLCLGRRNWYRDAIYLSYDHLDSIAPVRWSWNQSRCSPRYQQKRKESHSASASKQQISAWLTKRKRERGRVAPTLRKLRRGNSKLSALRDKVPDKTASIHVRYYVRRFPLFGLENSLVLIGCGEIKCMRGQFNELLQRE